MSNFGTKRPKKEEIRARLSIHGIAEMNAREFAGFKKWIRRLANELSNTKDRNIFNKNYRATLYKP